MNRARLASAALAHLGSAAMVGAVLMIFACGAAVEGPRGSTARSRQRSIEPEGAKAELFYRGEQVFARRGSEEWELGDVTKEEMVFSPDRRRFAYLRERPASGERPGGTRVLVRNLAGDPVNEFPVYRAAHPEALVWVDDRRLGYLVPPADSAQPGAVYVMHDVVSGEILAARSGVEFSWNPEHRHVAFVTGAGTRQAVVVDGKTVWPRAGLTRVHGTPVWSTDGRGLAFTDEKGAVPRLVVLVEYPDASGDLTWNIPREAIAPGLKVFWAGDSKVVIGDTALKPRFAADWMRLR